MDKQGQAGTVEAAEQVAELQVGDAVIVRWTTRTGRKRRVRAEVIRLTEKRAQVQYVRTSSSGGGFSMQTCEPWHPRGACTKVAKVAGELSASDRIGAVVMALAGKPGRLLRDEVNSTLGDGTIAVEANDAGNAGL
jgi:hypothetical protein